MATNPNKRIIFDPATNVEFVVDTLNCVVKRSSSRMLGFNINWVQDQGYTLQPSMISDEVGQHQRLYISRNIPTVNVRRTSISSVGGVAVVFDEEPFQS